MVRGHTHGPWSIEETFMVWDFVFWPYIMDWIVRTILIGFKNLNIDDEEEDDDDDNDNNIDDDKDDDNKD